MYVIACVCLCRYMCVCLMSANLRCAICRNNWNVSCVLVTAVCPTLCLCICACVCVCACVYASFVYLIRIIFSALPLCPFATTTITTLYYCCWCFCCCRWYSASTFAKWVCTSLCQSRPASCLPGCLSRCLADWRTGWLAADPKLFCDSVHMQKC